MAHLEDPVTTSICWACSKANASGDCEWANSVCREPVPGWDAEEIEPPSGQYGSARDTPWYIIRGCPKFEHD